MSSTDPLRRAIGGNHSRGPVVLGIDSGSAIRRVVNTGRDGVHPDCVHPDWADPDCAPNITTARIPTAPIPIGRIPNVPTQNARLAIAAVLTR